MSALAVGAEAPAREYGPLTTRMFVRYAGATGDLNPMHYDDEVARGAGYPSVFSQGMHLAALLAGYAVDWLGPDNVRRFAVRFRGQAFPGDVVTCSGRVTDTAITDEGTRLTLELTAVARADSGDDRVVTTAVAEFLDAPRIR